MQVPRSRVARIGGLVALALPLLLIAVLVARAWLDGADGRAFLAAYPGHITPPAGTPEGFPGWLGWTHALNAFFLLFIVSSGLHLRQKSRPPAFVTRRTSGPFAARSARARQNPPRLGLHTWWHLVVVTLWITTGLIYVVLLAVSGHWQRLLPTDWAAVPNAISAGLQYLSLDWPDHESWMRYNSLQQLSYSATVFVAAPLALLTGLRLSPLWPQRWMRGTGPLGDRAARLTHGAVLWWFIAFTALHTALVLLTGARRNLNGMYLDIDDGESWLGLAVFALSVVVSCVAWVLLRPPAQASIAEKVADVRRLPAPPKG